MMHAHYRRFLIFAVLLTMGFALPLINWVRFALHSGLFSYVLLIPFISGYLFWIRRDRISNVEANASWWAVVPASAGLASLAAGLAASGDDVLTCQIIAYYSFLWSGGLLFLGLQRMRRLVFPAFFLIFMAPAPSQVVLLLETGLQYMSAEAAYLFIKGAGLPVFRSGFTFYLPGIVLQVAPECSGIRSTLVLFITSLVAGNLFLRTGWTRLALALFVIPLGIIRNAFRILVLAYLTVRVDPVYINAPIHHQGGPIFFALSLIPFGIVLYFLWKIKK